MEPSLFSGRRARSGVAFGAGFLVAARLVGNGRGWSVAAAVRQDLPEGLVLPSALKPNVRSVSELAQILGAALEGAGCERGRTALLLPDLSARGFVVSPAPARSLLSQIAPRLPFPESEVVFDVYRPGRASVLAAAVRRPVLEQYEQALEVLGYHASVVEPASLVRVPEWTRRARRAGVRELSVYVQVHPRHYTLAVFRGGDLVDFRLRLRPSGDTAPILDELARLGTLHENCGLGLVSIAGDQSSALGAQLEEAFDAGRIETGEDSEEGHLKSLLAALGHRI